MHSARRPPLAPDDVELLVAVIETQTRIATAGLTPEEVVRVIVEQTQRLTDSSGAVVELHDGDEMVYWAVSGTAEAQIGLRLSAAHSLSGLCVRTGNILRCDDSETDERVDREACRRVGLRSMLVVPLVYRGVPVGVLKVLSPNPNAYGARDVRALELMSDLIGASLGRAVTYSALVDKVTSVVDDKEAREAEEIPRERIREVIDRADLRVVFQPIVDLRDERVQGLEALARFHSDPPLRPDRWFTAADRFGLGVDLELTAASVALRELDSVPPELEVGINASPETALSEELRRLLESASSRGIVLEITEHASVEDYDELRGGLSELRAAGVKLAIDDAGAGFASLRHILHLEPDIIKLDISLTRDIDANPRQQVLAASLVTFAAETQATILAEGIETDAELQMLKVLGVSLGQGYLLGRPEPLEPGSSSC